VIGIALLVAGASAAAHGQSPAFAGTWDGHAFVNDTAVTALTLVATPHGTGWTLAYGAGAPIATRVLAAGGDSVVTESGPYASTRRRGQTVLTRVVWHVHGDTLTGTFEAAYSVAGVTRGRMEATRRR